MTRRYYRSEISESSIASNRLDASRARLSRQGVLGGSGRVERLSGEASDIRLDVDYRGKYAERMARELREILSSNDIEAAPFAAVEESQPSDAYYTAELVDDEPAMPQAAGAISVGANLTKKGTQKEQTITVETSPSQPDPGHPFGNDTDAIVGIPADARRVRIVDSTSQPTQRERPTPVATVEAKHGAVDQYDATAEAIDDPVYLYDLDYQLQGDVDAGVWDTYGHDSILDADDVVAWGRVFSTSHDFAGAIVIENGLLRLTIDEPTTADATAALETETYDAGADTWTAVDLPSYDADLATDWQPADVDLMDIGQARVAAQIEFEAVAGTNAGDVYAVDVELERGRESLEVWIPGSVSEAIPPDLEALLDPIASTSVVDTGVEQGLVAREEVRL
ncbi:hypothetical protein ABNG02_15730 [Halorubrum ejinorense]|uniref:Virus ReqiPepy6 Gp37-like protein n=1 Tax=Halorubrum ejinorense TaxID=425309 RepID=A0AAV3SQ30_9EURY